MAKWFGTIGFFTTTEIERGLWSEGEIVERKYYGEMLKNLARRYQSSSDKVNDDVTISNDISILADPFAQNHFSEIRYVEVLGTKWKVTNVEVQYPRLILTLGGVYNG